MGFHRTDDGPLAVLTLDHGDLNLFDGGVFESLIGTVDALAASLGASPSNSCTSTPADTTRPRASISSPRGGVSASARTARSKESNTDRSNRLRSPWSRVRTASGPSSVRVKGIPAR